MKQLKKPRQVIKAFDLSGDSLKRLPRSINALSYRIAVNRHNGTVPPGVPIVILARRSDKNTGIYYLMKINQGQQTRNKTK